MDCMVTPVHPVIALFTRGLCIGVASKQKTRTMSAFLGGEGGGGLKFQKTRTFWGFFSSKIFFFTGVVHDFDQNL